jgi:hypothetical protein
MAGDLAEVSDSIRFEGVVDDGDVGSSPLDVWARCRAHDTSLVARKRQTRRDSNGLEGLSLRTPEVGAASDKYSNVSAFPVREIPSPDLATDWWSRPNEVVDRIEREVTQSRVT